MQAARRRSVFDLTSRLGRRAEAGPRRVLPRVRRHALGQKQLVHACFADNMGVMAWNGKDFVGMLTILSMDLMETYERLQTDPFHQPARRTWVRTFCSQVEAFAFGTKQMLASFGEFPWIKLTPHDVLLLREETYEIANNGDVKLKTERFVPIQTNLKFVARIAARALEFEYELDTNGEGWRALVTTFAVRNRLVHPKAAVDLIVTDDELKIVNKAQDWFQAMHRELWQKIDLGFRTTPADRK